MQDSFVFYRSFYVALQDLPPEEYKETFNAIMGYALNDDLPELTGIPKMAFELIKPQLDANNKRRTNSLKGGRPKKEKPMVSENAEKEKPMVSENAEKEKPMVSKNAQNKKPNVNVNVNGNVNGKEGERKTAPLPQEVFEMFNAICKDMQPVKNMTYAREQKIARNGVEGITIDDYREAFTKAQASPFLKGDNSRKWKAGFDWLTDAKNMTKVIEGNYDKKSKGREERDSSKYDDLEDFFAMELQKGAEQ